MFEGDVLEDNDGEDSAGRARWLDGAEHAAEREELIRTAKAEVAAGGQTVIREGRPLRTVCSWSVTFDMPHAARPVRERLAALDPELAWDQAEELAARDAIAANRPLQEWSPAYSKKHFSFETQDYGPVAPWDGELVLVNNILQDFAVPK